MKSIFKLALLSTIIIGFSLPAAQASDGTISFTGSVTDSTCTVKVNGAAGTASTVKLPAVSASVLSAKNAHAGETQFTIDLTGCQAAGKPVSATNAAKAYVYFEPGANVTATGTLRNTGDAKKVDLQLLAGGSSTPIVVGDAGQIAATGTPVPASGDIQLPYIVRYHATGPATAGTVTSSVVYDVVYN